MEKKLNILFMGTPDFAVASLGALLINGYSVVGVVTSPDKPAGRGRKIKSSAVAKYASENYLNLLQPTNLKDPDFIEEVRNLKPDIAVVVAFRMLPHDIWRIPRLGTFNLHASLLPQYRGAAPINHAIMNGEVSTGITTFLIDDKIDTGNILLRKEIAISKNESAGELHDRLMTSGAKLVIRTINLLISGKAKPTNQSIFITDNEKLWPAPKLFSKDCFIDWSRGTLTVFNFIRGLSPYPGARVSIKTSEKAFLVKILKVVPELCEHDYSPGTIISDGSSKLKITTSDGMIEVVRLQVEGKKSLRTSDFLRGSSVDSWSIVTNLPV